MNLIDAIESQLVIQTGDGKKWTPLWRNNCAKEIEYNLAQFDFPRTKGSLIYRGTPMARKFNFEIYFQGEDNLDVANSFEASAEDPRPWSVSHPVFGSILVQPVGMKVDYSFINTVCFTGSWLETLGTSQLSFSVVPFDKINADKATYDDNQASSFEADQNALDSKKLNTSDVLSSSKEIATLKGVNKTFYNIGIKYVKLTEDAGQYFNAFNAANAAIDQLTSTPLLAMKAIQTMVNFPALMVNTIQIRLSVLDQQFQSLRNQLSVNINTPIDKRIYEILGCCLLSAKIQASISGYDSNNDLVTSGRIPDYKTRKQVLTSINSINSSYSQFLQDIDGLQTPNGGLEDSYMPNGDGMAGLSDLVNYSNASLTDIALNAKQERTHIVPKDTNVILLAHRFYGLQPDDSTIEEIIDNNNICLDEIMQVQKGREIIYYI